MLYLYSYIFSGRRHFLLLRQEIIAFPDCTFIICSLTARHVKRTVCERQWSRDVTSGLMDVRDTGDTAVDVGSDRRGKSADRGAVAVARCRLRQAGRGGLLLGTTTTSRALLTQVSQRIVQTDVSTSRPGNCVRATTAATADSVTADHISK